MKKLIIILVLSCAAATYCHAQKDDARYRREFAQFLDYSLAGDFVRFMKEEMDAYIAKQEPLTASKMLALRPQIDRLFDEFVTDQIMPMYREHLSYKDLRKINKFYRTRPGRALHAAQMPVLMDMLEKTEGLTRSVMDLVARAVEE